MARYALRLDGDRLGLSARALLRYPEAIDLPGFDPAGAELGVGHCRTVLEVDIGTQVRLRVYQDRDRSIDLDFDPDVVLQLDPASRDRDREVTLGVYARALEPMRAVDVLALRSPGGVRALAFWASVAYDDPRTPTKAKRDASFAFKLMQGEQAERIAACHLVSGGHLPVSRAVMQPQPFVVLLSRHLGGHRISNNDILCLRCGLQFEVKARPDARDVRVSHSAARPFAEENDDGDFHVFVKEHSDASDDVIAVSNGLLREVVERSDASRTSTDWSVRLPSGYLDEHGVRAGELRCAGDSPSSRVRLALVADQVAAHRRLLRAEARARGDDLREAVYPDPPVRRDWYAVALEPVAE